MTKPKKQIQWDRNPKEQAIVDKQAGIYTEEKKEEKPTS